MTNPLILVAAAERVALWAAAAAQPRRRLNHNLHPQLADPVQRLLNALAPGTYIRPHRHGPGAWELFALLAGAAAVLIFDDEGRVLARSDLAPGDVVEIAPRTWHSLVALAPETVVLEVKPGPYRAGEDKDFAVWAPPEGASAAPALVAWMERATPTTPLAEAGLLGYCAAP